MSDPDVLAELDAWIATCDEVWGRDCSIPKRARDEIVALREMREAHIRMLSANLSEARAEALEEAARVAREFAEPEIADNRRMNLCRIFAARIAAAIRALKDKRDE